jgi:hypothetical protein
MSAKTSSRRRIHEKIYNTTLIVRSQIAPIEFNLATKNRIDKPKSIRSKFR